MLQEYVQVSRLDFTHRSFYCYSFHLGCAQESDVNQDIVDFAMAQLSYGDCQRGSAQIHNFKSQVLLLLK